MSPRVKRFLEAIAADPSLGPLSVLLQPYVHMAGEGLEETLEALAEHWRRSE